MNWQEFISKLLDQDLRMSSSEVESKTGIRYQIIDRWKRGEVDKPQRNTIKRLEDGLKIRINDYDPADISYVKEGSVQYIPLEEAETNRYASLPQYKIMGTVPAGIAELNEFNDWQQSEDLYFDPREHFYLSVDEEFGYSMMPLVSPGDLVLCSGKTNSARNGDIVAARWDDTKGALKILNINPDIKDMVVLTSYNQAVEPIFVPKSKVKLYKVVLIKKKK